MTFYNRARPPCQVCGEYMRRQGTQGQDTCRAGGVAARPWRLLKWPMGWGACPGEKVKRHHSPLEAFRRETRRAGWASPEWGREAA